MSPDHNWIAVVGGWMGTDARGHNGIFLVQRQSQKPDFDRWQMKQWFDVRGMTIGEIEFGPDDTLMTTSHRENAGGAAPVLTLFNFAGQNLGSFLLAEWHGNPNGAAACRMMRLERIDETRFAVYDPEASLVRFVTLSLTSAAPDLKQTRATPVHLEGRSSLVLFHVLPNRAISIVRTVVDQERRGHTVVSLISPDGNLLDEWTSARVWRYGYVENEMLKGVYPLSAQDPTPVIAAVDIQ